MWKLSQCSINGVVPDWIKVFKELKVECTPEWRLQTEKLMIMENPREENFPNCQGIT